MLQCLLALTRSNAVGGKFHVLFKKVPILFIEHCVDLAGQVDVVGDPEMEKPVQHLIDCVPMIDIPVLVEYSEGLHRCSVDQQVDRVFCRDLAGLHSDWSSHLLGDSRDLKLDPCMHELRACGVSA